MILLAGALVSCQKETSPAATDAVSSKQKTTTGLVQGPPPILTWSTLGILPYKDTWAPNDTPIEEQYSQGFSINGHGFICGTLVTSSHETNNLTGVLFEYDPTTRIWNTKSPFPGSLGNLVASTNFVIGDNAYIIAGNQTWQYNQPSDTWTPKASVSTITDRWAPTSFAVDGKGYYGLGQTNSLVNGDHFVLDWWQYDPASDTWTAMHDFPGTRRSGAAGFAVDGKGYVATGEPERNVDPHTVWQYDPAADQWTKKADFPGPEGTLTFGANATVGGVDIGFLAGNGGVWEYNPATDVWGAVQNMPGGGKWAAGGFVLGKSLFVANLSAVVLSWTY
jgi:N-acetylneuraminic acid mutarotase